MFLFQTVSVSKWMPKYYPDPHLKRCFLRLLSHTRARELYPKASGTTLRAGRGFYSTHSSRCLVQQVLMEALAIKGSQPNACLRGTWEITKRSRATWENVICFLSSVPICFPTITGDEHHNIWCNMFIDEIISLLHTLLLNDCHNKS